MDDDARREARARNEALARASDGQHLMAYALWRAEDVRGESEAQRAQWWQARALHSDIVFSK